MSESQYLIAIFIIFSLLLVIFLIWILNTNGKKIRKTKKPKKNYLNSDLNIDVDGIEIQKQPDDTVQIVNNTNENYLHVFCQHSLSSDEWKKADDTDTSSSSIYPPINWAQLHTDGSTADHAWTPLGAKLASEVIIPKNGYIILKLPPRDKTGGPAWNIMAVKMIKDTSDPLVLTDSDDKCNDPICNGTISKVLEQSAILMEFGREMVADVSAVDGINFKVKQEVSIGVLADGTLKTNKMEIKSNPCKGLRQDYKQSIGCQNPAKVDCVGDGSGGQSADCKYGQCKFNNCSTKLFDIPSELDMYKTEFDTTNTVQSFLEHPYNIKADTPLDSFCTKIHDRVGDNITPYCYDYNDKGSSDGMKSPYRIKITFSDLEGNDQPPCNNIDNKCPSNYTCTDSGNCKENKPSSTSNYSCKNGNCVSDTNGAFTTQADCMKNCSTPTPPPTPGDDPTCSSLCSNSGKTDCACSSNQCFDNNAKVCAAIKDRNVCKNNNMTWCTNDSTPTYYSCDTNYNCVPDSTGITLSDCNKSCINPNIPSGKTCSSLCASSKNKGCSSSCAQNKCFDNSAGVCSANNKIQCDSSNMTWCT
jgi:hypothetical protein